MRVAIIDFASPQKRSWMIVASGKSRLNSPGVINRTSSYHATSATVGRRTRPHRVQFRTSRRCHARGSQCTKGVTEMRFERKIAIGRLDVVRAAHPRAFRGELSLPLKRPDVLDDAVGIDNVELIGLELERAAIALDVCHVWRHGVGQRPDVQERDARLHGSQLPIERRSADVEHACGGADSKEPHEVPHPGRPKMSHDRHQIVVYRLAFGAFAHARRTISRQLCWITVAPRLAKTLAPTVEKLVRRGATGNRSRRWRSLAGGAGAQRRRRERPASSQP